MGDATADHERARLERLLLAISDMDDTEAAARHLLSRAGEELHWQIRLVLQTGMFTTYARAFNASRGKPPLPPAPTKGLSEEQLRVHRWAITERNTAWAHVDRTGNRGIHDVYTRRPEGMKLVQREKVRPASREELLELAELAAALAARYRDDVERLDPDGG